jgi:hypothetical protein
MPARGDQHWRKSDRHPGSRDGFHLVALTGPGQIWLQSMPMSLLAQGLQPYLARQGAPQAAEAGAIGGIIGNIMRGQ